MSDYRKWDLTIKNGQIFPWPTIGKDAETVPVIELKAYEDLLIKMKETQDMISKYQKNSEELIAIIEKQKLQLKQSEMVGSKTFEDFLRGRITPQRR